ncbi:MAG: cache domain-containing protein [Candidatus Omnitrophica bacterium]|nr:cache domain-containing protein [Candidatus Omnitrophota bacterium]
MKLRKSLYVRTFLFFIIVAFLPLFSASFLFYSHVQKNTDNLIKQDTSNLIDELKIIVEDKIVEDAKHLKLLAESHTIRSGNISIEDKTQEMRKINELFGTFDDIALLDPEGVILASLKYDFTGDWKYKKWFKSALEGRLTVSPVHIIAHPTRFVVVVTSPVFDSRGKVTAVLAGRIRLENIWDIIDRIKIGKTGFIFITDASGKIIAFPDKNQILSKMMPENLKAELVNNESGIIEFVDKQNAPKICFYSTIKGNPKYTTEPWRIGIIQDRAEAYAIINKMVTQLVLIVVVCILLIFTLAFIVAAKIVKPIKSLAVATEAVARGNLNAKVQVVSKDEIGELAIAFNKMIGDLSKVTVSRDDLLKEIVERKKAEEESVKSENKFRVLFESSLDAITTLEPPSWKITSGNPAIVVMFKVKDEADFISHEFWDFSPEYQPDGRVSAEKAKEMIEIALRDGSNLFEWLHKRLDGEEFITTVLLTKMELAGKTIFQATVRDITERKKLEEEAKRHLHELEIFYKVSVGREERIIELKKEIGNLKKELGK